MKTWNKFLTLAATGLIASGAFAQEFRHANVHEAGIAVVMGTPTATPPIWLSQRYPDVLNLGENGQRTNHGGRRHSSTRSA
ncbi:MAG: beta-galactosidase, partial [Alphaproteobacteria bacterium]|nr:beta-galactosidase [Alphaproteobacteria bacterium]